MTKKIKILVIFGIFLLFGFVILWYLSIPKIMVEFLDVQVCEHSFDEYNDKNIYLLDKTIQEMLRQEEPPLKAIVFQCNFNNQSLKDLGVSLYYSKEQQLPNIILGQKLGPWLHAESLVIRGFEKNVSYDLAILVRDDGYSDEELIQMVKNIELVMFSNEKAISKPFTIEEVMR